MAAPNPVNRVGAVQKIVVPKLKHSLSLALQHYLPLAGNVTWAPDYSKPIIDYVEGNAVSLTVAESEADFYLLSGDNFRDSQYFNHFLPCLVDTETRVPVLALQVTLFPNVGFSIGYAVHHGVLDGKTTTMFMHSWAFLCTHEGDSTLTPELTPFYDRTLIVDPSNLQTTYLNFWLGKDAPNNKSLSLWDLKAPPDTMLGTFLLTQANIENIKKWVRVQWEKKQLQNPSVHVSSFVITTAYTWVCLFKARQIRGGKGDDGIAIAVKAIGEAIQGLKDGVLKGKEDLLSRAISIPPTRFI
ncbi:hypothetical protein Acr_05g0006000 [Actinidia rufa]|uniref:HXXXD-type acyl-transferase family protein n=1 Tax=Actinidia rufa TaxID=165716 RepID=A0A7J0EKG3_9ERIC|nr:hypothetical protein Acr_05g0006000 [Actinidia rufa]